MLFLVLFLQFLWVIYELRPLKLITEQKTESIRYGHRLKNTRKKSLYSNKKGGIFDLQDRKVLAEKNKPLVDNPKKCKITVSGYIILYFSTLSSLFVN